MANYKRCRTSKASVISQISIGAIALAVPLAAASAQTGDVSDSGPVVYEQAIEFPDAIAYLATMRFLTAVAQADRASAVSFVEERMGLPSAEADEALKMMQSSFASYEKEYENLTRNLLCPKHRARATGTEIYPIFDALQESDLELGAKYYSRLLDEMGREYAIRFRSLLASQKGKIKYEEVDYRTKYEELRAVPDETLHAICSRLDQ